MTSGSACCCPELLVNEVRVGKWKWNHLLKAGLHERISAFDRCPAVTFHSVSAAPSSTSWGASQSRAVSPSNWAPSHLHCLKTPPLNACLHPGRAAPLFLSVIMFNSLSQWVQHCVTAVICLVLSSLGSCLPVTVPTWEDPASSGSCGKPGSAQYDIKGKTQQLNTYDLHLCWALSTSILCKFLPPFPNFQAAVGFHSLHHRKTTRCKSHITGNILSRLFIYFKVPLSLWWTCEQGLFC